MKPMNILLMALLLNLSSYASIDQQTTSYVKKPSQKVETIIDRFLNAEESVNAAACCSWSLDPAKPIPGCMKGC